MELRKMKQNRIIEDNCIEVFNYENGKKDNKNLLVIVPSLSTNGAQTVLYNLLNLFKEMDYNITIMANGDGEFRDNYSQLASMIMIRRYVACSEEFRTYLNEAFVLVFINSTCSLLYLYLFINQKVKTLVWFHETKEQILATDTYIPPLPLLSSNITVLAAHPSVKQGIKDIQGVDIDVLPIPIRSTVDEITDLPDNGKVVFFAPAAYSVIKGQDRLLNAIAKLPPEYIEKTEFIFCGYDIDGQEEYKDKIFEFGKKFPNVVMLERLSYKEMHEYYEKCDCVVAPSRLDSGPSTIPEAMMHNRLVIVSSEAGISEYITDCVNGFVFKNDDELFQRILLVASDLGALKNVAEKGNQLYKEIYSEEKVKQVLSGIIEMQ